MGFIDSCRAGAALAVFGFHITPHLSGIPAGILGYGWLGVDVFFVLSGFVIAHSVGKAAITPRYVANFIFRRSLRLDPPYWIVIAGALLLTAGSNIVVTDRVLVVPSWQAILANAFYLQNILGYGDIVDVFWSLCIEVQLYLVFIILIAVIQAFSPDHRSFGGFAATVAILVFLPTAIISQIAATGKVIPPKVWFLTYWNEFFYGAVVHWYLARKVNLACFTLYTGALVVSLFTYEWHLATAIVLFTGILLLTAGIAGWLHNWPGPGWMAGLGRMSYSFYLLHTIILARVTRFTVRCGLNEVIAPWVIISTVS